MQRSRMLWVSVSIVSLLLAGFVALSSAVAATDCHLITHLGDPAPECATVVPAATALPLIAANTTNVPLAHIAIPPIAGKTGSFDILESISRRTCFTSRIAPIPASISSMSRPRREIRAHRSMSERARTG